MTPPTSAAAALVLACATMVALVAVVMLRMLAVRVAEMKALRLPTQAFATSLQRDARLTKVQAADNYRNLFEMPVLFYAACALLLATGQASPGQAVAAWVFVALRIAHSLIHCTYNNVDHRFAMYAASSFVVFGMWIALAARWIGPTAS